MELDRGDLGTGGGTAQSKLSSQQPDKCTQDIVWIVHLAYFPADLFSVIEQLDKCAVHYSLKKSDK